ncbi:MAG: hypothetical protein J0H74_34930 [Chitinophagaceae bacterium]|nr:hypothetical protein [Chitinophagaceae bacterium]
MRTLTVGIALLLFSCGKSYHDPNNISVTVDGKTLQSSRVGGTANAAEFMVDGHLINRGDTALVHIVILAGIGVGEPDQFQNSSVVYTTRNGFTYSGDATYGGHGILTVVSLDSVTRRIAGTFEGVFYNIAGGSDSLTITNGRWDSWYAIF